QFDPGVPEQRPAERFTAAAHEQRADRHAAEEDDQDDDLRVRTVADEQAQVPRPDRFVDETRGARDDERGVKDAECYGLHPGYQAGFTPSASRRTAVAPALMMPAM